MTRTRWAAVGAAVAVTLGGGGLIGVSAAGPGDAAALVTVDPVRILDTRGSDKVDDETYLLQVTGSVTTYANGSTATATVVPAGASSVSMNLTVTEGVRNGGYGFVTAFPCTDAADTVPNASTINFVEGTDVANGVTVPLGADGEICLNVYGEAHLIVDVSGYYSDSRLDDLEAEVDQLIADQEVLSYGVNYSPQSWISSDVNPGTLTRPSGGLPFLTLNNGANDSHLYLPVDHVGYRSNEGPFDFYYVEICLRDKPNAPAPQIEQLSLNGTKADGSLTAYTLTPVLGTYPLEVDEDGQACFDFLPPSNYPTDASTTSMSLELVLGDNPDSSRTNEVYLEEASVIWFDADEF